MDNHLDFDEGLNGSQSTLASYSTTSSSAKSSRGRTKASRIKLQRTKEDEPWRELEQEITKQEKVVRFSLSPTTTNNMEAASRKRLLLATTRRSNHSCNSSSENDLSTFKPVRGAGTDVFAVQHSGSYRMVHDDTLYLCSTIPTMSDPTNALCELALMMSLQKTRRMLWTNTEQISIMDGILTVLSNISAPTPCNFEFGLPVDRKDDFCDSQFETSCTGTNKFQHQSTIYNDADDLTVPSSQETACTRRGRTTSKTKATMTKRRLTDTALEALAIVAHFISWDCTTSSHSASHTAGEARKLRTLVLEQSVAVLGLASLILHEPVVRRILHAKEAVEIMDCLPNYPQPEAPLSVLDEQGSNASSAATESSKGDPTSFGRRQRKRRRIVVKKIPNDLDKIPEDVKDTVIIEETGEPINDALSFASETSHVKGGTFSGSDDASPSITKTQNLLTEIRSKLVGIEVKREVQHTCGITTTISPAMIALEAMLRIVQGKEGDEDSCIDNLDDEAAHVIPNIHSNEETEEESFRKEEATNPFMMTNFLLRKSGSLPRLARGMAETLAAVMATLGSHKRCSACLADMHHRLTILASLIDGACCLSAPNRQEFCSYGCIIGSILQFLDFISGQINGSSTLTIHVDDALLVHEIALISIRTLTSLSHENSVADGQLMKGYTFFSKDEQLGPEVIADLLFRVVDSKNAKDLNVKGLYVPLAYDITIFCLNTLTNAIEAVGFLQILARHKVGRGSVSEEGFISWLSHWVVSQTESFRDGVMHGTFGKSSKETDVCHQGSNTYLDKDADENLVTAGNGFILLACCMIQSDLVGDKADDISRSIRVIIDGTMPRNKDGSSTGFTLIKNTLKAFCNFYYYSVHDLSVAVVAPVKKLIAQLETIEN